MTILAAVDGSALHNPGPAGWCWYIDDSCWAAGGWKSGTNNRGELTALAELLRATADHAHEPLHVLCDSQYVINSVTKWMPGWKRKGWKKSDGKPVLNVDILKDIDQLMVGRNVHLEWVKGHSGHEMNEAADKRARAAATAYQQGTEVQSGPGFGGQYRKVGDNDSASSAVGYESASSRGGTHKSGDSSSQQEGLFDINESAPKGVSGHIDQDAIAAAAQKSVTLLRRAAHRAEQGNARALRALLHDALGADFDVPVGLSDATHDLRVVGSTAVVQFVGNGWTAMAAWDLAGVLFGETDAGRLVGWNVGRSSQ